MNNSDEHKKAPASLKWIRSEIRDWATCLTSVAAALAVIGTVVYWVANQPLALACGIGGLAGSILSIVGHFCRKDRTPSRKLPYIMGIAVLFGLINTMLPFIDIVDLRMQATRLHIERTRVETLQLSRQLSNMIATLAELNEFEGNHDAFEAKMQDINDRLDILFGRLEQDRLVLVLVSLVWLCNTLIYGYLFVHAAISLPHVTNRQHSA